MAVSTGNVPSGLMPKPPDVRLASSTNTCLSAFLNCSRETGLYLLSAGFMYSFISLAVRAVKVSYLQMLASSKATALLERACVISRSDVVRPRRRRRRRGRRLAPRHKMGGMHRIRLHNQGRQADPPQVQQPHRRVRLHHPRPRLLHAQPAEIHHQPSL